MKKQTTPKPPAKTSVSIVRPLATVTIEIQGATHKLTEAEAKDLHTKLSSALGILPPQLQQPRQDEASPFIPRLPDHWLNPTKRLPYWDQNKIMC